MSEQATMTVQAPVAIEQAGPVEMANIAGVQQREQQEQVATLLPPPQRVHTASHPGYGGADPRKMQDVCLHEELPSGDIVTVICDGHGFHGRFAAEWVSREVIAGIRQGLLENYEAEMLGLAHPSVAEVILHVFPTVQDRYLRERIRCGTTCSVMVVDAENLATFATLGDSPCYVFRPEHDDTGDHFGLLWVSEEHSASNPLEQQRIQELAVAEGTYKQSITLDAHGTPRYGGTFMTTGGFEELPANDVGWQRVPHIHTIQLEFGDLVLMGSDCLLEGGVERRVQVGTPYERTLIVIGQDDIVPRGLEFALDLERLLIHGNLAIRKLPRRIIEEVQEVKIRQRLIQILEAYLQHTPVSDADRRAHTKYQACLQRARANPDYGSRNGDNCVVAVYQETRHRDHIVLMRRDR